ncbi:hypothetical protein [Butyrivibrio sp. XPD2006]|uniref:hypothetical protein n=1 Tax=Butyrivibrio sp. XPD2006 TaxID=1280668 RepID=UPI0003B7287A|nr:hypothetical protein [Butyrivibrio sp. XPD2006]
MGTQTKTGNIIVRLIKEEQKGDKSCFKVDTEHDFDRSFLAQKGIWALWGKDKELENYVCLNVGKSVDVGREILYDMSCLTYVSEPDEAELPYINQFGEGCGFNWNTGETQECLYPFLAQKYDDLIFVFAYDGTDETNASMTRHEIEIAHDYHSLYWRNGKVFENQKFEDFQIDEVKQFKEIEKIQECFRKKKK